MSTKDLLPDPQPVTRYVERGKRKLDHRALAWYNEAPDGIHVWVRQPDLSMDKVVISWRKLRAALERRDR
jgi:hypothetical protein